MSYHQAPSPPYQCDAYSPVSPAAMQDNQRHETHTPKRRRMGSVSIGGLDPAAQPFIPGDEMFDFSFSPPADFGQHSPPPINQNNVAGSFSPSWDLDFRWEDMQNLGPSPEQAGYQQRLSEGVSGRPQFSSYLQYGADTHRNYRQPQDYYSWSIPRMGGPPPMPPYLRPPFHHTPSVNEPPRHHEVPRHSIPQPLPIAHSMPPMQRAPMIIHPAQPLPVPATNVRRKGAIILTLSRADEESIEAIPEHKRECPTCQLEFEHDNYLAVISCCGTAMHALCLSAWVNSQHYSKSKVCMKCRKPIDARRALNNVVSPATDKSWDSGMDFNAPPHIKADNKTEIDVSGRTDANYRRMAHMRRDANYYRRRTTLLNDNQIDPDSRAAFQELQRDIRKESDDMRSRYRSIRQEWRAAFEVEARAAQIVVEAKDSLQEGTGMTQREVEGLSERLREAKEMQEIRHAAYRVAARELDEQDRRHQARQMAFLEQTMRRQGQ